MIVFTGIVFEGSVSTQGTAVYQSDQATWLQVGQSDKFFVQAVVSQIAGTGALTLTVKTEHSNDGVNFTPKTVVPINAQTITAGQVNPLFGNDPGTTEPNGAYVRFVLSLGGTTPTAYVRLFVTARAV